MSTHEKALHIRLSPEQTRRLHEWAAARTVAEIEADCEPSGFRLDIAIGSGVPAFAEVVGGGHRLDLGEVEVVLLDEREVRIGQRGTYARGR